MHSATEGGDEDDEFGFSSSDEADFLALADASSPATKRKASFADESPPPKRPATESRHALQLAVKVLKQNFGVKSFRLKQEEVISRILGGGSAAVVFPTGGGKSLCYQIPALVFSEMDQLVERGGERDGERDGGITLVVSPLIALMKDQVDVLVRRKIKAAVLDSTKKREEYLQISKMLRDGELRILYCAPERLNNEGFVEQMKYVRGGIRLLAVDEAHCISEWGHAFRPDYLKISRFATEAKVERVICLTATATPRVAEDICNAFKIDEAGLFRTSTYRPHLRLLAESARTKQELYPKLFSFLRKNPGSSIVYVTIKKQTEVLAEDLRDQGFEARAFHAGMTTAAKTKLQDEFMQSNSLIMVSTIAFGMGIDKANIRNVVHFNIPNSLESYSQEIGRAGRDGKTGNCMFFICGEDLYLREIFARGELPSHKSIRRLLWDMFNPLNSGHTVGSEFKTSHTKQERSFDMRATTLRNIYALLELNYQLIRAKTPVYTTYSFQPGAHYRSTLALDNSPAARAIKLHEKCINSLHHVDVDAAATSAGTLRNSIVHKLNDWNEEGILELKTAGVLNVYEILKPLPATAHEIEKLSEEIYSILAKREQEALLRTEQMLQLITNKACFSKSLAQYFGDDLPDGRNECRHCTWCLTHQAVAVKAPPPVGFNWDAFEDILSHVRVRDDPRFLARIAFGIKSPRVTAMKLSNQAVFGSMANHKFMDLLHAFTKVCQ